MFRSVAPEHLNQSQLEKHGIRHSISLKCQHIYFSQSKLFSEGDIEAIFLIFKKEIALRYLSLGNLCLDMSWTVELFLFQKKESVVISRLFPIVCYLNAGR